MKQMITSRTIIDWFEILSCKRWDTYVLPPEILYLSVWYSRHNRTHCRDHTEIYKQLQYKIFRYRFFKSETIGKLSLTMEI